jgi:glycosyltransferase involved in cell wall biosynthesis
MPKTIFVNGRFLTHPVTGVQRYSHELLGHMDHILDERADRATVQLVCLVPRGKITLPPWKNIVIRQAGLFQGDVWEQIELPLHAGGRLLFSPANIGPWHYRNQVLTLHDASVFAVPGSYSLLFRARYAFVFTRLAGRARGLLTDSEFSRAELAKWLRIPPGRLTVVSPGGDHLDGIAPDPVVLERHALRKMAYLLVVGGRAEHKNVSSALRAVGRLSSSMTVAMVGAGPARPFRRGGREVSGADVRNLGYVDDRSLKALYENALALILPSTYEGFGLPVLEAMRCGCAVLCSNTASLPEVAGDAALYFDPNSPDQIAAAIERLVRAPALREDLRATGIRQAGRFEWASAARQTLAILTGQT